MKSKFGLLALTLLPLNWTKPALPSDPCSVSIVTDAPKTISPRSRTRPPSVLMLALRLIVSELNSKCPPEVAELRLSGPLSVTVSVPTPPSMYNEARNAASTELIVIVSSPAAPRSLIVSEPVGFVNVTDSANVESIVIVPVPASDKVMTSASPMKLNTRSVAFRLSVIGSSPV